MVFRRPLARRAQPSAQGTNGLEPPTITVSEGAISGPLGAWHWTLRPDLNPCIAWNGSDYRQIKLIRRGRAGP